MMVLTIDVVILYFQLHTLIPRYTDDTCSLDAVGMKERERGSIEARD